MGRPLLGLEVGTGRPGDIDFAISLETRVERKTATGSGAGGAIGQNSGDPYGPGSELGPQGQAIMQSALQAQNVTTTTLKLKGQLLAEFINTPVVPGLTYGWAPGGTAVIAYSSSKRRLAIMNSKGRRRDVAGTKDVLLPAWSEDGSRLAWVERSRQGALVGENPRYRNTLRRNMLTLFIAAWLGQAVMAPAQQADATAFTLSAPKVLVEVDAAKLKGEPIRLAWGAEQEEFYLRWTETDRFGNERTSHLLVGPNSTTPAPADGQPPWAATYWFWKSASAAPGVPDMKFDLETRQQMKTATGTVRDDGEGMHNTVAKGAPELTDANQAQKVTTTTITLKGQLIVESVNKAVVPGMTFGWAPSPMGVLAFVDAQEAAGAHRPRRAQARGPRRDRRAAACLVPRRHADRVPPEEEQEGLRAEHHRGWTVNAFPRAAAGAGLLSLLLPVARRRPAAGTTAAADIPRGDDACRGRCRGPRRSRERSSPTCSNRTSRFSRTASARTSSRSIASSAPASRPPVVIRLRRPTSPAPFVAPPPPSQIQRVLVFYFDQLHLSPGGFDRVRKAALDFLATGFRREMSAASPTARPS